MTGSYHHHCSMSGVAQTHFLWLEPGLLGCRCLCACGSHPNVDLQVAGIYTHRISPDFSSIDINIIRSY